MRRMSFVVVLTICAASLPAAKPPNAGEIADRSRKEAESREMVRKHLEDTLLQIGALPQYGCMLRGDFFAINYRVNQSGHEDDWRDAGFAIQASHSKQLSEAELAKLRLAILALPTKSVRPTGDRMVQVGFWDGPNWVTRTYDSESLPPAMRQIYDIIGERFETRKDGAVMFTSPRTIALPKPN